MDSPDISSILKRSGFKDTSARRLIISAFREGQPLSADDIRKRVEKAGGRIDLATVYRTLGLLQRMNVLHRHPCDGKFALCAQPGEHGHHGFLHCMSCGKSEEFMSAQLIKAEEALARSKGFAPMGHLSEITGLCSACHS